MKLGNVMSGFRQHTGFENIFGSLEFHLFPGMPRGKSIIGRSVKLFDKFLTMNFTTEEFIQTYTEVFDIFSRYQILPCNFIFNVVAGPLLKSTPIQVYLNGYFIYCS